MARRSADPTTGSPVSKIIISRWPTGAKIFLILSIALLPLALIALFATLQITRISDDQARAGLRLAALESSRSIAIELIGDMTALRAAVAALEHDSHDAPSCARAQGVFAQQSANGTRFAIFAKSGRLLCGSDFPAARDRALYAPNAAVNATLAPGRGLILSVAADRRGVVAAAFFPIAFLSRLSHPDGVSQPVQADLLLHADRLNLQNMARETTFERREMKRIDLGIAGLVLEMQVRSAPITSPLLVAMILPLLMWIAAAGISWFVVDYLLIRPLRDLRGRVAAFTPGEEPDPALIGALPAHEIRELGDTFRALTRTVALHEAGLAEGLVRQTKLTREVHHRVKNNLQVISSLINLHARGAPTPEAGQAYASIQRRVDALAVVHRNHFAEMEENRGLALRPVIGELAGNIRANAPEGGKIGIVVDIDPYLVTQDVAVAVAFLATETIELAIACDPNAQIRLSLKSGDVENRAVLRISSPALIEDEELIAALRQRYGRVMEGLSRQLRAPLHHDPLIGAYEISIPILAIE